MDVKTIADGLWDAVTLGLVASVVTTFSMWVKEFLARVRAWWEMRRNPYAFAGARLHEWRDAANRPVIGACAVKDMGLGRIVLRDEQSPRVVVLTNREFQAGHALWDVGANHAP